MCEIGAFAVHGNTGKVIHYPGYGSHTEQIKRARTYGDLCFKYEINFQTAEIMADGNPYTKVKISENKADKIAQDFIKQMWGSPDKWLHYLMVISLQQGFQRSSPISYFKKLANAFRYPTVLQPDIEYYDGWGNNLTYKELWVYQFISKMMIYILEGKPFNKHWEKLFKEAANEQRKRKTSNSRSIKPRRSKSR